VTTIRFERAVLLNRMMFAIASRVRDLVLEVTGASVREVPDVGSLPLGGGGLLIVGRQHLLEAGGVRYGHQIVADGVRRLCPDALMYVLPGDYEPHKYDRDLEALEAVSRTTPVFVLEFPAIRRLGESAAIERAEQALAKGRPGRVHWLLSNGPGPLRPVA
jgi:hypothetical protein